LVGADAGQWRPAAAALRDSPPTPYPESLARELSLSSASVFSLANPPCPERAPRKGSASEQLGPQGRTRTGSGRRAARRDAIGLLHLRPDCAARDHKGAPRPGRARRHPTPARGLSKAQGASEPRACRSGALGEGSTELELGRRASAPSALRALPPQAGEEGPPAHSRSMADLYRSAWRARKPRSPSRVSASLGQDHQQ
jgi:hypothetical protein